MPRVRQSALPDHSEDLAAGAREAKLRDYADRVTWKLHPHWKTEPGDSPSDDCLSSIRQTIEPHAKCNPQVAVEAIGVFIVEYHLWKRHSATPDGDAFREWTRSAVNELERFE